ncbi:DNA translocase SpoIIIE [Clostridium homopropionicum DSM 5847]|uniref:DNA translocase SpoIIIE n=1 Tax=Clostridium homopropionicum DSM 5847 TaxID=1121318 RepID=A0A0L6ZD57_9CLOT|nr:DNA translocase FtsK [Clostridium homopropionicum]KOA20887.1 DNA translocase SpoIIIE [Clostridium homopropionicum DSM 5847]SFG02872.1 DNA segregation ATPase FtsK/SpoIIIE, S-DNA-T family [Clostridium homopropionicum]
MARKNSKSNKKTPESTNRFGNDIKGILLITVGVLMLLSVFITNSSGLIGITIKKTFIALMGLGSYFFPLIIILTGVSYIIKNGKVIFNNRFYGIILFITNSLMLIQMININKYYINNDILQGIKKIYSNPSIFHGGIITYLIDIPLYKLFGSIGSYFIMTAIYIISIVLIVEINIKDIFMYFRTPNKDEESIKQNNKLESKIEDNQSSFIKNINHKIKMVNFMKSTEGDVSKDNVENREIKVFEPRVAFSKNNENLKEKSTKVLDKNSDKSEEGLSEELNKEINEGLTKNEVAYIFPPLQLLNYNENITTNKSSKKELINIASKLEETLSSFGVEAKVMQVTKGPSVTRFELQPSAGVKVSKITHLSDDIALSLAASSIRIEAPIPGKSAVGIEIPNKETLPVFLKEVIESEEFRNFNKNIAFAIGKDIGGKCVVADLSKMPHLLIAGATGSGKSVCINTLIVSLLYKYTPEEVKLLLVDPKVVELNIYNNIPHLLIPVVTNPKKAAGALNWAVTEMSRRYNLFAENSVRNIEGYNELYNKGKIESKLPWVVIIIDELADLMMVCPGEVEEYIARLAQMARAAGMHLVIATQRPSVDVITGVIKANIPSRISFAVSSQIDSRTIIDSAGAEKLLGKGDMLYYPVGESKPIRIQGAFISEEEVEKIVNFIKSQKSEVTYEEGIIDEINSSVEKGDSESDDLLDEAIEIVLESGQISTSFLQRRLRIGYNRAARIIEQLEDKGIISGKNGTKPRQVLLENDSLKNNK